MAVIAAMLAVLPALPPGTARAEYLLRPRLGVPLPYRPAVAMPSMLPSARAAYPPGLMCREAIRAAERAANIPDQLMAAIGRVESGKPDASGVVHPWPWTINAEGVGSFYESKAAAIAAVRALQARGVQSIDIGCMQVNLMHHPNAFASLEQGFDPAANASYAARFLNRLYAETGSWTRATANYHSATPELGDPYQRKVAAVLPEEQKHPRDMLQALPNVWSVNAWTANAWNTGPGAGRAPGARRPAPITRLAARERM
ncbi:MAG TPA: lytic transglycosylase domain-containing protein [Acetobacteraceae bacterium]